jgi:hypothetical protein
MRWTLALLALTACDGAPGAAEPDGEPNAQPTPPATSTLAPRKDAGATDAGPHGASEALRRCAESKGDVASIAETVTRFNAILAKGGDAACFVATLPRPLAIVATLSTTSAQPAGGRGAPRLFLMLPKLVVAVVPDGEGSKVLELGEWTGTTATIKAEIALPVTSPLAASAPFEWVLQGNDRTTCATCHGKEEPHATIPSAFVSDALRPSNEVTLEELEELHTLCTSAGAVSSRCEVIHALFDFGAVTQGAFSPVVAKGN